MEGGSFYLNDDQQMVNLGLARSLILPSPDFISYRAQTLNNYNRKFRFGLEMHNNPRLCARNLPAYTYMRPHKRGKFVYNPKWDDSDVSVNMQAHFYQKAYRHYVPTDLLTSSIRDEMSAKKDQVYWQGNVLAGINDLDEDVYMLFYPSGKILENVSGCIVRPSASSAESCWNGNRESCELDIGSIVRQIAVFGGEQQELQFVDEKSSSICIFVRGQCHSKVINVSCEFVSGRPNDTLHFRELHDLHFDQILTHICTSPHTKYEACLLTSDGMLYRWTPHSGNVRCGKSDSSDPFHCAEYSSHPCVLWSATTKSVHKLDLRQAASGSSSSRLYTPRNSSSKHGIVALQRLASCADQLVLHIKNAIEIIDSRMPRQALLTYPCPSDANALLNNVAFECEDKNPKGAIFASSREAKCVSVYSYAYGHPKQGSFLQLNSLRHSMDTFRISHYCASDSALDIRLRDGSAYTTILGMCVIQRNPTSNVAATVYQISSLGDIHAQDLRIRGLTSAEMLPPKRCPDSALINSRAIEQNLAQKVPIPVDAILQEHDAASLMPYKVQPIHLLFQSIKSPDQETKCSFDCAKQLKTVLTKLCKQSGLSVLLHRLQCYIRTEESLDITCSKLLEILKKDKRFHLQSVSPVKITSMRGKVLGRKQIDERTDSRLSQCICPFPSNIDVRSPCESYACLIPHTIVVTFMDAQSTAKFRHIMPPFQYGVQNNKDAAQEAVFTNARSTYND